ncbi:putative urease accessory protein UreF-like like [Verticillium longisporum]|nr:putative urease accessory protein UreF-like like [Verticillium longisporum]
MDSEHDESIEDTQHEIAELEAKLAAARQRLQKKAKIETTLVHRPSEIPLNAFSSANHYILLLSDSALPLGSFAFSSGLESYLAHTPRNSATFSVFLPESISSYASTTLPFVLTAYRDPSALATLDDTLDAAIICTLRLLAAAPCCRGSEALRRVVTS